MRLTSSEKYIEFMNRSTDSHLPWDEKVNLEVMIGGRLLGHTDLDIRAMGLYYASRDTISISMDIYCDYNNTINRLNWVFFHELMHRVGLPELACTYSEIIAKAVANYDQV